MRLNLPVRSPRSVNRLLAWEAKKTGKSLIDYLGGLVSEKSIAAIENLDEKRGTYINPSVHAAQRVREVAEMTGRRQWDVWLELYILSRMLPELAGSPLGPPPAPLPAPEPDPEPEMQLRGWQSPYTKISHLAVKRGKLACGKVVPVSELVPIKDEEAVTCKKCRANVVAMVEARWPSDD